MAVALVQGGSGALGSAFARHLLSRSPSLRVVATTSRSVQDCRDRIVGADSGLQQHKDRLDVLQMDATNEDAVAKASEEFKHRYHDGKRGGTLRLLLNVSGVLHPTKSIQRLTREDMLDSFNLNCFAHMITYKHFLAHVARSRDANESPEAAEAIKGILSPGMAVLASVTARVSSIGDNGIGGWIDYRSSKAATNQVVKTLDHELRRSAASGNSAGKGPGAIAVSLHPGTVAGTNLSKDFTNTDDIGKKDGVFSAPQATGHLLDVIKSLDAESGGRFLDYAGKEIPW